MAEDQSESVKDDVKSRMDQSVPRPDPQHRLGEKDKRGLELQGEIEHATGERREEIAERAKDEKGSKT